MRIFCTYTHGCRNSLFMMILSSFVHTIFMLRVSFSTAPECVDADCWNRLVRPLRGTKNTVIVVAVVICLPLYFICVYILFYFFIYIWLQSFKNNIGTNTLMSKWRFWTPIAKSYRVAISTHRKLSFELGSDTKEQLDFADYRYFKTVWGEPSFWNLYTYIYIYIYIVCFIFLQIDR